MKVCIFGLGAVGGLIAGRLALAGTEVSAVARGETLVSVRRSGMTLIEEGLTCRVPLRVEEDPAQLGAQDLVILAVKNTALKDIAPLIAPLLGKHTAVLSAMNGVPWWFCIGLGDEVRDFRLETVDPAGVISRAISPERVIGCVCNLSASTPTPGTVAYVSGPRLTIGEPTGGADTERCIATISSLRAAGFDVVAADSIQQSIWFKLWGNMTVNPISALTHATGDRIVDDILVRDFMSRCMLEASAVGESIGLQIPGDPYSRHAVTRRLGAFRTSMLQDVEAGRPTELDALVGAVLEIARWRGIATPNIDALFGLARLQARCLGLYPEDEKYEK